MSVVAARIALVAGAATVALVVFAPAARAERSWVIQGDTVIGGYAVKKDGTLAGAIRQFGPPTRIRRDTVSGWNGCSVQWRALGLRIYFYNLAGRDSCEPRYGYFRDALVTGKRWRTASGLRIGLPTRLIHRYHPGARQTAPAWRALVTRPWVYGDGGTYVGLAAKTNRGRVSAFSIYFQAGGD